MTHVLVVEDEEITAGLIRHILTTQSYEVTVVGNAESGWQLLQENTDTFEVLLLDRSLPGMDGMALLKRIKDNETLRRLPVVMETSLDDLESVPPTPTVAVSPWRAW